MTGVWILKLVCEVDCYVNVPSGRGPVVREALLSAMPMSIQQHPPAFTATRLLPEKSRDCLGALCLIDVECTAHVQ